MSPRVAVIGAGLSGSACARALRDHGITVDLIDRGRRPGGRMASPLVHDRRVDLGAAYFTAKEPEFVAVVDDWVGAGLAKPWTDVRRRVTRRPQDHVRSGAVRGTGGLRSLVEHSVTEDVRTAVEIADLRDLDHDAVVLAMPDPQAARLAPTPRTG